MVKGKEIPLQISLFIIVLQAVGLLGKLLQKINF